MDRNIYRAYIYHPHRLDAIPNPKKPEWSDALGGYTGRILFTPPPGGPMPEQLRNSYPAPRLPLRRTVQK